MALRDTSKVALNYIVSIQDYRCVNIHALYNDIVKYGLIDYRYKEIIHGASSRLEPWLG